MFRNARPTTVVAKVAKSFGRVDSRKSWRLSLPLFVLLAALLTGFVRAADPFEEAASNEREEDYRGPRRPAENDDQTAQRALRFIQQTQNDADRKRSRGTGTSETLGARENASFVWGMLSENMPTTAIGFAAVQPVDAPLRSQLELKDDQGLIVVEVSEDSPAAAAGIRKNDILLTLGEHSVHCMASLNEAVTRLVARRQDVTAVSVPAMLVRAGRKQMVRIQLKDNSPSHDALVARVPGNWLASGGQPSYWLGVQVSQPSDIMRAQLQLPDRQGLVVNAVEPFSPANSAGIETHDILLEYGGKPTSNPDAFAEEVQKWGKLKSSAPLKILRRGETLRVGIVPVQRRVARIWTVRDGKFEAYFNFPPSQGPAAGDSSQSEGPGPEAVGADGLPLPAKPNVHNWRSEIFEITKAIEKLTDQVESLEAAIKQSSLSPDGKQQP